ncbi:hypothetical protein AB5J56_44480 [Streptomyces sp. R21]|uniref:Uncharacterized protein n=1 Tax=Streptomyces sp. R21 TaxID=3238627 RepID=A0AB39PLS5_9ACTN
MVLTAWKKTEELALLGEVSSVPLQQALRHLQVAFTLAPLKTLLRIVACITGTDNRESFVSGSITTEADPATDLVTNVLFVADRPLFGRSDLMYK